MFLTSMHANSWKFDNIFVVWYGMVLYGIVYIIHIFIQNKQIFALYFKNHVKQIKDDITTTATKTAQITGQIHRYTDCLF